MVWNIICNELLIFCILEFSNTSFRTCCISLLTILTGNYFLLIIFLVWPKRWWTSSYYSIPWSPAKFVPPFLSPWYQDVSQKFIHWLPVQRLWVKLNCHMHVCMFISVRDREWERESTLVCVFFLLYNFCKFYLCFHGFKIIRGQQLWNNEVKKCRVSM